MKASPLGSSLPAAMTALSSSNKAAAATKRKIPPPRCRVAVASENYGRIVRTLEKKVPVTMLVDIENKFYDDDLNSFNIIGEIPGSDKAKADEVVMLGGHFDSWQSGTGATDNGAGSAVMLEAMRILKATGVKMRRTVRIGLWTGEEQGLLGSRAYIKQHFGDRECRRSRHPPHQDTSRARPSSTPTTTSTTAPAKSAASISRETKWSLPSSTPGWFRFTISA